QKQIPREVVADGQRITAAAVAHQKVALKVGTPTLIRDATLSERFAIGRHSAPPFARLNQTRALQDFTGCRICRRLKFRSLTTQPVQHFFRTPLLTLHFGLHDQRAQLRRGLIGMPVRRAVTFLKSWQPKLIIPADPFISRRSANPVDSAKLAFAVFAAQPISYQLNPLVHGTGFLPRHWHHPPCRRNVNHVPGLFCKLCYRFVPTLTLSQREREELRSRIVNLRTLTLTLSQRERELRSRIVNLRTLTLTLSQRERELRSRIVNLRTLTLPSPKGRGN